MLRRQEVQAADDNFRAVDEVSHDVFERWSEDEPNREASDDQTDSLKSRFQRLAEILISCGPKLDNVDPKQLKGVNPGFDFSVTVEGSETDPSVSLTHRTEAGLTLSKSGGKLSAARPDRQHQPDALAWRYALLPKGAKHLENARAQFTEEEMMSAIKAVMIEQKRELSKRKLPDLAAQEAVSASPRGAASQVDGEQERASLTSRSFWGADFSLKDNSWSILLLGCFPVLLSVLVDARVFFLFIFSSLVSFCFIYSLRFLAGKSLRE